MKKKKSVIILGKGDLSIKIADWFLQSELYQLRLIVPVTPEPKWTGSLSTWSKSHGIPIVESGHFKDIPEVYSKKWEIDLAFSVYYDRIIKDWFINKCARIVNLHNGPLPKYRGVSPINWALKNDETSHGVTIHNIEPGIDDGPVVSQVKFSIYPEFDEVIDVYNRCLAFGWELFQETMPIFDKIKPTPQKEEQATYYSLKDNDKLTERRYFTKKESIEKSEH